jgi:hypothetical protein
MGPNDRPKRSLVSPRTLVVIACFVVALIVLTFAGYGVGKTSGQTAGLEAGRAAGYTDGHKQGFTDGYSAGNRAGTNSGYSEGYGKGVRHGRAEGRDAGATAACWWLFQNLNTDRIYDHPPGYIGYYHWYNSSVCQSIKWSVR